MFIVHHFFPQVWGNPTMHHYYPVMHCSCQKFCLEYSKSKVSEILQSKHPEGLVGGPQESLLGGFRCFRVEWCYFQAAISDCLVTRWHLLDEKGLSLGFASLGLLLLFAQWSTSRFFFFWPLDLPVCHLQWVLEPFSGFNWQFFSFWPVNTSSFPVLET